MKTGNVIGAFWLSVAYLPTLRNYPRESLRIRNNNRSPGLPYGSKISWIKSSYELFCALIWNFSHFLPKFNFLWFKVRFLGNFRTYFITDKDYYNQGFWYFAGKKARFRGIFRGKFTEKWADFAGFSRGKSQNSLKNRLISWEKSQNLLKNRPILRDFSGKKSNFEEFSGANRKIGRSHRKFRGETSPRNNQ